MKKLLVIARKVNDLFYALSTIEWEESKIRDIMVISKENDFHKLPLLNLFDNIYFFEPIEHNSICRRVLENIIKLRSQIKGLKYDLVILSNPFMTINQYIVNKVGCESVVWIEDGLMNYYNYVSKNSKAKKIIHILLGINENKYLKKINKTYLLNPRLAKTYFGVKTKIHLTHYIDTIIPTKIIEELRGKRIFVGQSIYSSQYGLLTIGDYNKLVNQIIGKYNIDYYLPHPFASEQENIDCKILSTGNETYTLEMLTSKLAIDIYSFNSTVLFSTKLINPQCNNHVIVPAKLKDRLIIPEILNSTCEILQED